MKYSGVSFCVMVIALIASADLLAEPLGRLFFTPQEREQLNGARSGTKSNANGSVALGSASNAGPRADGFVMQARGKPVIWVNGKLHDDLTPLSLAGMSVKEGRIVMRVNEQRMISLAPGQVDQQPELGPGNQMSITSKSSMAEKSR